MNLKDIDLSQESIDSFFEKIDVDTVVQHIKEFSKLNDKHTINVTGLQQKKFTYQITTDSHTLKSPRFKNIFSNMEEVA